MPEIFSSESLRERERENERFFLFFILTRVWNKYNTFLHPALGPHKKSKTKSKNHISTIQRDRQTDRQTGTERERETTRQRQTDRERQTETEKETDRQRDRESRMQSTHVHIIYIFDTSERERERQIREAEKHRGTFSLPPLTGTSVAGFRSSVQPTFIAKSSNF